MNKIILAGVAGAFLAGSAAMASEPVKLTNGQMDDVTAGFRILAGFNLLGSANTATTGVGGGTPTQNQATGVESLETFNVGTGGTIALLSNNGALANSQTTAGYFSTQSGSGSTGGALSLSLLAFNP